MNLLIKSTTIFATILAATSGVNAGCTDPDGPGPTTGMQAAKVIVERSDWFVDNCPPMMSAMNPQHNPEDDCKQFTINYCIGHMKDAVKELNCWGNPTINDLNSWANECSSEVSSLIPTPSPSPNPRSYDPVKEGYKAGTKAIDDFYGGDKSKCFGLDKVAKKLNAEKFPANQGTTKERAYNQSASIATVREAKTIMNSAECFPSASANFVHLRGNQK